MDIKDINLKISLQHSSDFPQHRLKRWHMHTVPRLSLVNKCCLESQAHNKSLIYGKK